MNKQAIVFGVVALIVGFFGGMVFTTPAFRHNNSKNLDIVMKDSYKMMEESHVMTTRQMMDAMTMKLDGKTGNEFDEAFLEQMIVHHLGAVQMAQLALTSSKRPEVIKMAKDILSTQQKEIEMMRGWQKTWFGIKAQ